MRRHILNCLTIGIVAAIAVMFGVMAWNHQWHAVPVIVGAFFALLTYAMFLPDDHDKR